MPLYVHSIAASTKRARKLRKINRQLIALSKRIQSVF